jgi:hypothetical protein
MGNCSRCGAKGVEVDTYKFNAILPRISICKDIKACYKRFIGAKNDKA